MERSRIFLLLFVVCLVGARTASAQDAHVFGVTMGYPASVGVLWQVTDGLALRPELSFAHISSEIENESPIIGDSSTDGNAVSVGLSALFYLAKWDMTRAYVVPRYAYSKTTTSIEGPFAGLDRDQTSNGHVFGVSFGAQHALGERFSLYGELGLQYDRSTTETATTELRRSTFGTRSGVGVVLYF